MPLERYGVVLGTVQEYWRDPLDDYGRYMHGNLKVATPGGTYQCAIDVDSKSSSVGGWSAPACAE